jgi:hypothetical protein
VKSSYIGKLISLAMENPETRLKKAKRGWDKEVFAFLCPLENL